MVSYDEKSKHIAVVQGEGGSFDVDITGHEMKDTDCLILNVREFPNENSPLVLTSVNFGKTIRIDCEATKNIPVGLYSAQIFLKMEDVHCPVQIWPEMKGTPKATTNMKNFVVYQRV